MTKKCSRKNDKLRRKNISGKFNRKDIIDLMKKQNHKCIYCKKDIKNEYHIDHFFPIAKGGTNDINNLQLLCPRCNIDKRDIYPEIYANKHGLLL